MSDSSNVENVSNELDPPFHFEPGTQPIPSELRTLRRLALLTLTISFCYGGNATLSQIHILNWAIRSRESREIFQQFHAGWIPPDAAVVRLDPTLARTLSDHSLECRCVRLETLQQRVRDHSPCRNSIQR